MKALRRLLMRFLTPEMQELSDTRFHAGFTLGLAQGELKGRLLLAEEIETIHGVNGGNKEIGLEQARLIKTRQVH